MTSKPTGMKYMFATLCSKPAATNALIGNRIAKILSVVVRAEYVSHTARQTRPLHKMPRTIAYTKSRFALADAMFRMFKPIAPEPNVYCRERNISSAVAMDPTKLPV